jgi:hypothetical protein
MLSPVWTCSNYARVAQVLCNDLQNSTGPVFSDCSCVVTNDKVPKTEWSKARGLKGPSYYLHCFSTSKAQENALRDVSTSACPFIVFQKVIKVDESVFPSIEHRNANSLSENMNAPARDCWTLTVWMLRSMIACWTKSEARTCTRLNPRSRYRDQRDLRYQYNTV